MSKKVGKQDIMARIMDRDILESFENIIIPNQTSIIEEILEKYGITNSATLQEKLDAIKTLCVLHEEDYPNVVERMILEEGIISKDNVPADDQIKNWFEPEENSGC